MEKKTGSAGFDGKNFYFEEKSGTRWILLNVAEIIFREGIQSLDVVRRQATLAQKMEAALSLIMAELRPLGDGDAALASSLVMLTFLDAMSWNSQPYRILRIGGHREDALSRGLGPMALS